MVRRLWLGILLIASAAAVLLISDRNQRKSGAGRVPRVAFCQHASAKIMDEGIAGMKQALGEAGFVAGQTIELEMFNAEGDAGTANAIARQITAGGYDLIVTMSTMSLQTVANANKEGRTRHVFGLVTDPAGAGVGIEAGKPMAHPKHLAGFGTMQPVGEAFRLAREVNPRLRRVGVAWNSAESNSLASVRLARKVAAEMGIELVETNVDSGAAVVEAAQALVARGVEAIWSGGDLTVLVALDAMLGVTRRAKVPVFSNIPDGVRRGTLFDYGANYNMVGYEVGRLAAETLRGKDLATAPIKNLARERLYVNTTSVAPGWTIPAAMVEKADVVVTDSGVREKSPKQAPLARQWKLHAVQFNNTPEVEETERGLRQGLNEAGLVEGRDYQWKVGNAQGDMATISGLIDAALTERAELLVAFSTPTLQSALRRVRDTPVVFTHVADALAAGAGPTREKHQPNITGVDMVGPFAEMIALIKQHLPRIKRVGTLFMPAEVNMVASREQFEAAARAAGIELVAVPVNAATEVSDAAIALTSRRVDAICQLSGNVIASSFAGIREAARKAKVPLLAFTYPQAKAGAAITLARDYHESGRLSGLVAARIMRGESPAAIPLESVKSVRLVVNLDGARATGFAVPPAIIKTAAEVIGR